MWWALQWDLAPLRPDEWAKTVQWRWIWALELRGAYQEGADEAQATAEDAIAGKKKIQEMMQGR